jgi:hypothetical protein
MLSFGFHSINDWPTVSTFDTVEIPPRCKETPLSFIFHPKGSFMIRIRLNAGKWTFDEDARLGSPGGFGEVFRGLGPNGPVAVKRLKLTASAAAHREMNIGQSLASRALKHVVPVLGA